MSLKYTNDNLLIINVTFTTFYLILSLILLIKKFNLEKSYEGLILLYERVQLILISTSNYIINVVYFMSFVLKYIPKETFHFE
jgi:hypothetical protein